jgi:CBS-domain-containing membrane protein
MTLLYGLTAAPASQPRNAILGQIVSLTIAICVGYADNLSIWMRQSLATALAVASMVKLGITHPPAGAAALICASGEYGWGSMLFVLIGNVIAICAATLINNWSDQRQYPSYWGVPLVENMVHGMQAAEAKKAV